MFGTTPLVSMSDSLLGGIRKARLCRTAATSLVNSYTSRIVQRRLLRSSFIFSPARLSLGIDVFLNDISNSAYGVVLLADGANIHSNSITLATTAGVELACNNGTVSDNRINDAAIGLDQVPLGFKGSNTFANTGMISTDGCGAAAASASSIQAPSQTASPSSFSQWRTPANPLGS